MCYGNQTEYSNDELNTVAGLLQSISEAFVCLSTLILLRNEIISLNDGGVGEKEEAERKREESVTVMCSAI